MTNFTKLLERHPVHEVSINNKNVFGHKFPLFCDALDKTRLILYDCLAKKMAIEFQHDIQNHCMQICVFGDGAKIVMKIWDLYFELKETECKLEYAEAKFYYGV